MATIKERLISVGYYSDLARTKLDVISDTSSRSFLAEQFMNRNSAGWKTAKFIILTDFGEIDDSSQALVVQNWVKFSAVYKNQFLILQSNNNFDVLDFNGKVVANQDNFDEFIKYNTPYEELIRAKRNTPTDLILPTKSNGISYSQYLPAIRTKPFLLLAGISGTGKSRIVKEMAFATCPNVDDLCSDAVSPGNYCLIEVKPNWHDSTELLGYHSNIKNQYFVTKFMQFVVKAMQYPEVPFFVCLDEMNLAPVEQYFAEFLSVLESRKLVDGEIVSEPLIEACVFTHNYGDWDIFSKLGLKKVVKSVGTNETSRVSGEVTTEAFERQDIVEILREKGLRIPQNLVVIGTVNMDETTHQFSRKVIDRAMTIEMNEVDFASFFEQSKELGYFEEVLPAELFRAEYTSAKDALTSLPAGDQTYIKSQTQTALAELNNALEATPFKVAYRVQNELVLYFHALHQENKEESTETLFTTALDHIMMMKVLPRIEGDDQLLEKPLVRLADFANTNNLTLSSAKIEEMSDRLNSAHFTSFWP